MCAPLEGIKVIDLTAGEQGPIATQMLGDLGADVIKVEQPGIGDWNRGFSKLWGLPTKLPGGRSAMFEAQNRSKRGMTINLNTKAGKEVIYRLVKKSDVFVQNFGPGVVERFQIGYDTLSKINPQLIYGSGSGYGPKGPESARPAVDWSAKARSGIMMNTGEQHIPPMPISPTIADRAGATLLSYGILVALLARQKTGRGQRVDSSLFGAMVFLQGLVLSCSLLMGKDIPRHDQACPNNPLWNYYQCKDRRWILLAQAINPDKYWPLLCRAMDLNELATDSRYDTAEKRERSCEKLAQILERKFVTKNLDEWVEIFLREIADFNFERVNNYLDLLSDAQAIENNYIMKFDHPTMGPIRWEGFPIGLSETPADPKLPPPELGQHTEEVLLELGYTWQEITTLKDEGSI